MPYVVHAEISYKDVHSDICPPQCDPENMNDEWKQLVRDCFEEFLEHFDGTGEFYIRGKWKCEHLQPDRLKLVVDND